eukprot:10553612-Alexandrium_andersonii.AAC.1
MVALCFAGLDPGQPLRRAEGSHRAPVNMAQGAFGQPRQHCHVFSRAWFRAVVATVGRAAIVRPSIEPRALFGQPHQGCFAFRRACSMTVVATLDRAAIARQSLEPRAVFGQTCQGCFAFHRACSRTD